MLSLANVDVFYGGIQALWQASLEVRAGEIVTIVGSNGAGKSTILRTVTGLLKPKRGAIEYKGKAIHQMGADEIVREGISMVPEGRELFPRMSVRENLELGAAYVDNARSKTAESLEWVYSLFPKLRERATQLAGTLSGGEQQMVAIGRALMSRPSILLMDEPSLGLSPLIVREVFQTTQRINREGLTILLVEQNVRQSLKMSHRAYVLENGRIVMEGVGRELMENSHVKEAYLGL
jgi:branched-chain amino acid transport system ATP-binding protein